MNLIGKIYSKMTNEDVNLDSPDILRNNSRPDGSPVHFEDNDAVPFFVLSDGRYVLGIPQKTHMQSIHKWFGGDPMMTREFVNNVILQGRYWKDVNYFSFWHLEDRLVQYAINAMMSIGDKERPCKMFYRREAYVVDLNNGTMEKESEQSLERDYEGLPAISKNAMMSKWRNDAEYARNAYVVSTWNGEEYGFRRPNNVEKYAIAAANIVKDYYAGKGSKKKAPQFSIDQWYGFVESWSDGKLTFDDLMSYYHIRLRKKLAGRNDKSVPSELKKQDTSKGMYDTPIEQYLNECGLDDTQYHMMGKFVRVATEYIEKGEEAVNHAKEKGFKVWNVRYSSSNPTDGILYFDIR